MDVRITRHARNRYYQRGYGQMGGWNDVSELESLAQTAWEQGRSANPPYHRIYNGFRFVFDNTGDELVLITLWKL